MNYKLSKNDEIKSTGITGKIHKVIIDCRWFIHVHTSTEINYIYTPTQDVGTIHHQKALWFTFRTASVYVIEPTLQQPKTKLTDN